MKAYLFPGQGSQAKGMGGDLFDTYPEMTAIADEVLGYSVKSLCLDDPRGELKQTEFTQPALFTVNALSYRHKVEEAGSHPDCLAGHSLGEFNALHAAGSFDFETGLKLVQKRGELMSQATGGAMAAILNGTRDQIEATLVEGGFKNIDLANFNAPKQIVISGLREEIAASEKLFTGDMVFHPLNTSGAFHSRLMKGAQGKFRSFLKAFSFSDPKIPVIANYSALPYKNGQVAATLVKQIASCVRWSESVEYLLDLDADIEIVEVGHGNVLTKLVDGIRKQSSRPLTKLNNVSVKAKKEDCESAISAESAAVELKSKPTATESSPPALTANFKKDDAAEQVRKWNSLYPVGTRVTSTMEGYDQLETRTQAVVLFGHRAAVYMKDYNGYFDLKEISPVDP
jgi:malonyl CoA-acyl carrier protein transacylase